ncbi:hypothetical protein RchiOBHm_Chr2g0171771 [Rosa chinensis]|uniref:Uncharacterized protein n=1 Tax=Rosa chinensis TaxID=74649 RepID=A0A2P6S5H3_ROSCH|nr:hypothetical protein RchiOBHm_Chr2g0171771 [Rosa chinensis]
MKSVVPSPSPQGWKITQKTTTSTLGTQSTSLLFVPPNSKSSSKKPLLCLRGISSWLLEKFLNQKPVYLDQEASNSQEDMKSW